MIDRNHENSIGFMAPVYEKEQVCCERETGLEMRTKSKKGIPSGGYGSSFPGIQPLLKRSKAPFRGFSGSGHHIFGNSRYLLAYTS